MLRRTRIGGIHTTIPLGVEICQWAAFRQGKFHTRSLEEWLDRSYLPKRPPPLEVQLAGIVVRNALSGAPQQQAHPQQGDLSHWGRAARIEATGWDRK